MKFLLRWLGCFVGIAVAAWIVPGVTAVGGDWLPFIATWLILALINVSIKPLMQLLSLPITVITLGLFYFFVNAALLMFAGWLSTNLFSTGIVISSFGSALIAALIVSIVSAIMNSLTGVND
jgi:putative membrane protein